MFACLIFLKHISTLQIRSDDERFSSYLLANELRQSSDNLTNMVRLYVMTGDTKYRQYFYEILAIRNGEMHRPDNYNQIYWDLASTGEDRPESRGEKKALKKRMIEHGFTVEEFNLLQESENQSNILVGLEKEAINAMEGKFDDGTGEYSIKGEPNPELARKIVFSKKYRSIKLKIMAPLQTFFEKVDKRTLKKAKRLDEDMVFVIIIAIVLAALSAVIMVISIYKALSSLAKATNDSEMLLLNVLPSPIADRLKLGEEPIADEIPQASVLFADIVGFTHATSQYGASKMVQMLNLLFDEFDTLSDKYGVEKVKTIGDNYMAVSGIPIQVPDHAEKLADFALAVLEKIEEFNEVNQSDFNVRIGMTYGAVVAGVIGHKKFIYDVWGDVVNTASRMESTGESGKIQITDKMAMMLSDLFDVIEREEIEVKGIGKIKTYFLIGRKGSNQEG